MTKSREELMNRGTPKSLEEAILNGLEDTLELEDHSDEAVKEVANQVGHHVRDYIRNKISIAYIKIKDPEYISYLDKFMAAMGHFKK